MKWLKRLFGVPIDSAERPALGRNDLCWCGSGVKYKRCHLDSDRAKISARSGRACATS